MSARSLQLTSVNFRADKTLVREANHQCKLERYGESRIRQSPYTKEQRLQIALEYMEKNGAMHIADYMELTGLSRTTATLELKAFRQDPTSGITFVGRGSQKVYVKKSVEE